MSKGRIAIIGGGISGLTAGWYIAIVTSFEKSSGCCREKGTTM